jgi:ribokinase
MGVILLISGMSIRTLKFDPDKLQYTTIIGTGGIGSGKFFVLNGNHTLGREESRSGHFLEVTDYCKQHIILHYIKILLGPSFRVIPVGKVGDDNTGQTLFREMNETGFVMNRVEIVPHISTLFSFCFYYPDGSGGNLTTDNSASAKVDSGFIEKASAEILNAGSKGIIMAAPEVPLQARKKLLELGKKNGLFCTASFTTGEIINAIDDGMIECIDLIAINIDEASAVAGNQIDKTNPVNIVQSAIQNLQSHNKHIKVSVTAGKNGSWFWDGHQLNSFPSVKAKPVSTAGAGDAFFSGIICGLALGLHFADIQQLASLIAGLSVTSPDTIHKGIDRHSLKKFSETSDLTFSKTIINLLED